MSANETNSSKKSVGTARLVFGIFMVLVYVVVGILCICGTFTFLTNHGISIALGILLIIYGIWRGIRLIKGWP